MELHLLDFFLGGKHGMKIVFQYQWQPFGPAEVSGLNALYFKGILFMCVFLVLLSTIHSGSQG